MNKRSTPLTVAIGKRILACRFQRNWTRAEFAERLCYEEKTVLRWEMGSNPFNIETLAHIANVLDVPVVALLPLECRTRMNHTPLKQRQALITEMWRMHDQVIALGADQ